MTIVNFKARFKPYGISHLEVYKFYKKCEYDNQKTAKNTFKKE